MPQITDWVIDADAHITEPADLWSSRLPAKYRDRAPRIERNADGVDVWHVGDESPLVPLGSSRRQTPGSPWAFNTLRNMSRHEVSPGQAESRRHTDSKGCGRGYKQLLLLPDLSKVRAMSHRRGL